MSFYAKLTLFVFLSLFVVAGAQASPVCLDKADAYKLALADMRGTAVQTWAELVAEDRCAEIPATYLFTLDTYHDADSVQSRVVEMLALGVRVYGLITELPKGVWLVRDDGQWIGQDPAVHKWFETARTTDEAAKRFGWRSCCAHADRVKTQFRVDKVNGSDTWWWLVPETGQWRKIPNYVIHSEPDPTMPEQLKREGVLFVYSGIETCFWIPEGGT